MPAIIVLMLRIAADRHVQPVDRAAVVARQREMDAGQRGDGAAGAQQADVRRGRREACSAKLAEGVAGALAHPPVGGEPVGPSSASRPSLSVSETTPHGALHQARDPAALPSPWSISTSSVEPPPMSKISAGPSPGSSSLWQPSTASRASSCGRDDLERDAGLVAHPVDEIAAVDGAAAGLGRDRARQRDVAAAQFVGADRQARRPRGPSRLRDKLADARQALRRAGRCARRRR